MDAEIKKWSIKQSKSFLGEDKEMASGNKQGLLERVRGVIFLNKKMSLKQVSDAINNGIWLSKILPDQEFLH